MDVKKIGGIFGISAPFVVFTCIIVAISSWSQFSWTNNALSDLGVQPGLTAPVFNGGLFVGGLFFLVFAAGLYGFAGSHLVGKAGVVVFALACLMLMAIGVFNENYRPTHFIVSVGLFTIMPISMLVLVAAFWVEGKRRLSVFTLTLAFFAAAIWVLEYTIRYVPGVAIPEFVSGVAGAIWVATLSSLMLKPVKALRS